MVSQSRVMIVDMASLFSVLPQNSCHPETSCVTPSTTSPSPSDFRSYLDSSCHHCCKSSSAPGLRLEMLTKTVASRHKSRNLLQRWRVSLRSSMLSWMSQFLDPPLTTQPLQHLRQNYPRQTWRLSSQGSPPQHLWAHGRTAGAVRGS